MPKTEINTATNSATNTNEVIDNTATVLLAVDEQIEKNEQFAVAVIAKAENKAAKGREIWDRVMKNNEGDFSKMVRKDMIALLMSEAGCTKTGAATYYQKMKEAGGYVNHKVV